MAVVDDFVMTLDSDGEDTIPSRAATSKEAPTTEDAQLNPDFVFDLSGDPYADLLGDTLDIQDLVKSGSKPVWYSCML